MGGARSGVWISENGSFAVGRNAYAYAYADAGPGSPGSAIARCSDANAVPDNEHQRV